MRCKVNAQGAGQEVLDNADFSRYCLRCNFTLNLGRNPMSDLTQVVLYEFPDPNKTSSPGVRTLFISVDLRNGMVRVHETPVSNGILIDAEKAEKVGKALIVASQKSAALVTAHRERNRILAEARAAGDSLIDEIVETLGSL